MEKLRMNMFLRNLTISFVIAIQCVAGKVGDECFAAGGAGVCVLVTDCEDAIRSVVSVGSHSLSRCGFQNKLEIVCCPQKKNDDKQGVVVCLARGDELLANRGIITKEKVQRVADRECEKLVNTYDASNGPRIIGGEVAELGEFPHMVALGYEQFSQYHFRCGGSLISDRHILTAGHCIKNVERLPPSFVRIGVLNISDTRWNPDTDYKIEKIFLHPNYSRPKTYHDLAIIRLTKPVEISGTVLPACLYTEERDPTIKLSVTGWGRTDVARGGTSDVLLKAQLTTVPRNICNQSYSKSRRLPYGVIEEQICALDTSRKMDACQGDSGGPLQGTTEQDGYFRLVGVISFGNGCNSPNPGIYTRIYKYLDWIESIVWPSK